MPECTTYKINKCGKLEKICNPSSGRCVLRTTKTGLKALKHAGYRSAVKRRSPKRKAPAKRRSRLLKRKSSVKRRSLSPSKRSPSKRRSLSPSKKSPSKRRSLSPSKKSPSKRRSRSPSKRSPAKRRSSSLRRHASMMKRLHGPPRAQIIQRFRDNEAITRAMFGGEGPSQFTDADILRQHYAQLKELNRHFNGK